MSAGSKPYCPECGKPATGNFCQHCGAKLGGRFCNQCGAKAAPAAAFCNQCGSKIEGAGPTDVLVACAGIGSMTHVPDLDTPALRAMLEVNVLGVAHAIDAVLPGMIARGRGHIVGVSSVAGLRGMPWMASYSASKAALWAYLLGARP